MKKATEYFFLFTCNILGWHEPNGKRKKSGRYFFSKCKHCGRPIIQMENGLWCRID